MKNQSIGTDKHVFVAGITGSGKSQLASVYLSQMPKVIKLDTKGEALADLKKKRNPWPYVDPKELVIVQTLDDLTRVNHPYVIYAPVLDELEFDAYNEFFKWVYFQREDTHTVTWVDEYMEVSDNPSVIPRYLKALYTKGRSRFTSVWTCTQTPTGVNKIAFRQSSHFFMFDLTDVEDRKKMSKSTGAMEMMDLPEGYNFWYFERGWRSAVKGVLDL